MLVGAVILTSAVAAEDESIGKRPQSRRISAGSAPFQGHFPDRRAGNAPRERTPSRRPRPSLPAPPYAVQMEPLVQYSQRDPLYHQKNLSVANSIEDEKTHMSRIDHQPEPSNSIADAVSPYDSQPQHHYDNSYPIHSHYYKEPEPIIEIIIKESNESLPAPPSPPQTPPPPPKKEPVQVFYIKYKKNPNSYGKNGEDDIIYEPPVPALTPPPSELESESVASAVTEAAVTYAPPPPPPSTTLRTIIHPDSEVYHGSGLKVTFGEPEEHYAEPALEEQSAPEPSISLPTSQIIAQNRDSSTNQFKRQQQYPPLQPGTYQTPPPPPQSQSFQQPPQSKSQFPRQSSLQSPPAFRPQHTNSFFPPQRPPTASQPTTHQPPHLSPQFNPRHQYQQSAQQLQLQHQQQKSQNQFHNSQIPTQLSHQSAFRSHSSGGNPSQSQQQYQQQQQSQFNQRPSFRQNENLKPQFHQQNSNFQPIAQGTRQQPQFSQQAQLISSNNVPTHSQYRSQPIHVQASPTSAFQRHQLSSQQNIQDQKLQQNQYSQLQGQRSSINQANLPQQSFQRGSADDQYKAQLKQQQQQQYQQLQQQNQQSHLPQLSSSIQPAVQVQHPTSINFPGPIKPKPKSPLQIAFEQQQQQQRLLQQKQQLQTLQESIPTQGQPQQQSHQQHQLTNRPTQSFDQQRLQQQNQQIAYQQQLQHQQQQDQQKYFIKQQQQQQLQQRPQLQHNQQNHQPIYPEQNHQNSNKLNNNNEEVIKAIPQLEQHQIQPGFQQPQVFLNQNQQHFSNEQINYSQQKSQKPNNLQIQSNKYSKEPSGSTQLPFISSTHRNTIPQKIYSPVISSTPAPSTTPKFKSPHFYSGLSSSTTPEAPVTESEEDKEARRKLEEERKEKEKKKYEQNLASLPQEVPDDIREQLLSSGILGNADIQILDYDKVGDIPIENLPPEALENLYGAGSAPVPAVAASPENITANAPVEMKVVRYDPATQEGQAVADSYVKEDATHVDPVVLNDARYNRYLPLKVSGTNFPLPDASQLQGRIINSVVVLAPVDYDFVQTPEPEQEGDRAGRSSPVQVQGVRFIAGDILKELVKNPTSENYRSWLDKEKTTPTDKQSVVLLVTR